MLTPRGLWMLSLAGIIAAGILSRVVHSGWLLLDKYLGDALYAAMVYALLRLWWWARPVALPAMLTMTAMELFQLTGVPAGLLASDSLPVRLLARLLGTEFSLLDLLAYVVGIGACYLADSRSS